MMIVPTGAKSAEKDRAEFLETHPTWLSTRMAEGAVVFRLPQRSAPSVQRLFQLDCSELQTEQAFDVLCESFHAIGSTAVEFVRYRWLMPCMPALKNSWLEGFRSLGWESRHIAAAREICGDSNDIVERMKGVAGRLVCHPEFLDARSELQTRWSNLPEAIQPGFPLKRSPVLSAVPQGYQRGEVPEALGAFFLHFDRFCDAWRLQGLATWDLPDPDGPRWPDYLRMAEFPTADVTVLDTPWHFPLREADGLGTVARESHSQAVAQHELSDLQRRPETYARLLEIDHWQRVLLQRYSDRVRRRGFITAMEHTLSDLLDVDLETLRKLRKVLSALKSGRRKSLAGWR